MSMHTKAYGEMHFLIFGNDPLVPMRLEQAFSQARPSDEVRFDSFEEYDQAYDFTKTNKNVGLVFLLENCGELNLTSVFEQLAGNTKSKDPCFGVLIHNGQESFKGLRAMKDNNNLIAYCDVNELLDPEKCPFLLNEIWQKYQDAYEKIVIPAALAQTYKSVSLIYKTEDEISFAQRLGNLLCGELNISWQESFILKWFPILEILSANESKLLEANEPLSELFKSVFTDSKNLSLSEIASSEFSLATKIACTTSILSLASSESNLADYFEKNLSDITPRSKAILRSLKRHQEKILQFSQSSSTNIKTLKVV